MFPISYKHTVTVDIQDEKSVDAKELLELFKGQFDNPKLISQDKIAFDGFNFIAKKHRWLDSGELKIQVGNKKINVEISLNFVITPIIFLLLSIGLVTFNLDKVYIMLCIVAVLWTVFSLLYLWTSTMYTVTIKNKIGRHLYSMA